MTFPEGYRRDPGKVRKVYAFATIAGTPEEIARLKERAREAGKTVSRFVLDGLDNGWLQHGERIKPL